MLARGAEEAMLARYKYSSGTHVAPPQKHSLGTQ